MELSKGANECLVQAHMLRMSADRGAPLCAEHLFYGLLLLAKYLDPPLNNPEFREEGEAVRMLLGERTASIASAAWQLEQDAKESGRSFAEAARFIRRATEIAENAGSQEIDAVCFAKAILESPTPAIRGLLGVFHPQHAQGDARYPATRPAATPPVSPADAASSCEEADGSLTASQFGAMLAMLAALEDGQYESLKSGANPQKNKKEKRRTKMGLFTYRGGTVAAAIQYFLFGSIIPFLFLFGLDVLTGAITSPSSSFLSLLIYGFIMLWFFYLVRGVNKLIGLGSKPLGHFFDILADCLLLFGLARAGMLAYGIADVPTWLRIGLCIGALLILSVGGALFSHLSDQGDAAKTKILFQDVEGTPGMIFFRALTKELLLPVLLVSIFWIFRMPVPLWLEKACWIVGFLWVWNVIFTMWTCMALRYKSTRRKHKGQVLVRFLGSEHILLLLPALGLYLHWLFGWFPMKTWVLVLCGIYGLLWLVLSIANWIQIKEDC
ncbi:MAG: hypothetical protein VB049_12320 [Candidatus Pelethousia sp.]|nr:hypothetical protein [Candidatus Pelethousia sp.]